MANVQFVVIRLIHSGSSSQMVQATKGLQGNYLTSDQQCVHTHLLKFMSRQQTFDNQKRQLYGSLRAATKGTEKPAPSSSEDRYNGETVKGNAQ